MIQDINVQLLPSALGVDAVVASRWFPVLPPGVFGGGRRWSPGRGASFSDAERYAYVDRPQGIRLALRRDAYRGGWWCSARFSASRVSCGGAFNSRPTSAVDLGRVLGEVERAASEALGVPALVGGWAVRGVEAFADVEVCWSSLRDALLRLAGARRFVVKEMAPGGVVLRSSRKKSPWALVFYPKDEQERRVRGFASPWSAGRVRVEARAWTRPAVRRVAGGGPLNLATVLLGGRFAEFLSWSLSRMGLGGVACGDPGGALADGAPGMRGPVRERLKTLLDDAGGRGWEAVLADPPACYRDPAGARRLRRDVARLRALGLLLPGAAENALLGMVTRSVVDAARRHEEERAAEVVAVVSDADGEAPGVAEFGSRNGVPPLSGIDAVPAAACFEGAGARGAVTRTARPP